MKHYEFIPPTREENETIHSIRSLLMQDREIIKYYLSPKETCEAAALRSVILLNKKYKCTIAELGIWSCANIEFNMPTNHYIVLARSQGSNSDTITYAIDLTSSQFNNYGIKYEIVDTLNNWFCEYQSNLNKKSRTLVKYRDMDSTCISDSKFSNFGVDNPFISSSSEILSSSVWYKEGNLPKSNKFLLENDISSLNNCWQSAISHKYVKR